METEPSGTEAAAERLRSGQAWDDFCDVLRLAGHAIDGVGREVTETDRAEWYRSITRFLRVACERYVENAEPHRPRLRITPWRTSINMQSPDQDHLLCEFSEPADRYRITGQRGTVPYFILAALAAPFPEPPDRAGAHDWAPSGIEGHSRFNPAKSHPLAQLSSDDITFAEDGTFVIEVGGPPQTGMNHLPLPEGTVGLMIRTVHHDRRVETPPTFAMHAIEPQQQRPVRPEEVADGLAAAAQMTLGFVNQTMEWTRNFSGR